MKYLKEKFTHLELASKIRYSYVVLLLPIAIFIAVSLVNLIRVNQRYDEAVNSVSAASGFSLDFQKDFDYETYLLIVGSSPSGGQILDDMLDEAVSIANGLMQTARTSSNQKTLDSVLKYLNSLAVYKERIVENMVSGNNYEENMRIWENDVQIVTALVRETMISYIYDETGELQAERQEYQNFLVSMMRLITVILILMIVVLIALSYYIPIGITRQLRELCKITDKVAEGDFSVTAEIEGGVEVEALSNSMNSMIHKINELIDQVRNEQMKLRKSEFELLQAQINPHFLYNTLDAIMWLADSGEKEQTVSMVRYLSDFFRTSLNQGKQIITIQEEIMHVESYLKIQQVRYQDILEYTIDVPQQLERFLIPKITIQPLIENSLYHGIKNKRGGGKISLTGWIEGDHVVLQVEDNGVGMTEEQLSDLQTQLESDSAEDLEIFGLYNVNKRIHLDFGAEYGLRIESIKNTGTKVSVILPCRI